MSHRFRLPKDRIVALAADWGLLLYLAYCSYFLINHWYCNLVRVSPAYRVPFPEYAYIVAIVATFLLALVWQNLGVSIGWKALGLAHADEDRRPLGRSHRLAHFAADLVAWPLTALGATLVALPLVSLGSLLYGIVFRTGLTLVPTIVFWPIGPWPVTLGLTAVLVAALAVAGAGLWLGARTLWRWLWPGMKGQRPWTDRLVGSQVCRASDLELSGRPPRWWQTTWGLVTLFLVGLTAYVGWLTTEISVATLIRRAPKTVYMWRWLAAPDFKYFVAPDPILRDSLFGAVIETVFMALMATVFGILFAFPLSFLGARNVMAKSTLGWFAYTLTRGFFNIVRSIEPIIMAVIFGFWFLFGPFAGVLALMVHTVAALGKLYSEQIEAIDPGPVEAITACGGRRLQILRNGVIPQVVPPFLAFTLYRWDINVRMATIVGFVGGGGIGRFFSYYKNEIRWPEVGAVVVCITVVVWLMDYVSGRVRERLT